MCVCVCDCHCVWECVAAGDSVSMFGICLGIVFCPSLVLHLEMRGIWEIKVSAKHRYVCVCLCFCVCVYVCDCVRVFLECMCDQAT